MHEMRVKHVECCMYMLFCFAFNFIALCARIFSILYVVLSAQQVDSLLVSLLFSFFFTHFILGLCRTYRLVDGGQSYAQAAKHEHENV